MIPYGGRVSCTRCGEDYARFDGHDPIASFQPLDRIEADPEAIEVVTAVAKEFLTALAKKRRAS